MTRLEFKDYVESFDRWAKTKDQHLVLLIDNAPSHKQVKLDNVLILFLPPNTTSVLQPLDAGIIRSFKAKYRAQLNMFLLDCKEEKRPEKVDLHQVVTVVRHAWDGVTEQCVRNCWKHTQILPADGESESGLPEEAIQPLRDVGGMDELRSLLLKTSEIQKADVDAYVDIDATLPTQEQMTDAEICQLVSTSQCSESEAEEDEPPPPIKTSAAKWMCRDLIRYFEERGRPEVAAAVVWKIYRQVDQLGGGNVQTSITDFFKPAL